MKTYEFLCGGDHGAWECLVSVDLNSEEESRLIEYAQDHEFLEWQSPIDDIYRKVSEALDEQLDDDSDPGPIMVWVPFGLRKDGL